MADEPDMDAPVTRRELREELAKLPSREDLAKHPTREDLAKHPTREELREVLREEFANYPTRTELHETLGIWAAELERRISAEMARLFGAYDERMRDYTRALLEPHDRVPERVTKLEELEPRVERLEAKVFAPKRRRRVAKRR